MSSYYSKKIKVAELLLEFGANPNHGNQVSEYILPYCFALTIALTWAVAIRTTHYSC